MSRLSKLLFPTQAGYYIRSAEAKARAKPRDSRKLSFPFSCVLWYYLLSNKVIFKWVRNVPSSFREEVKRAEMSPSTRFQLILFFFIVFSVTLFPRLSAADQDPCGEMGMYIGNHTTLDLWYTRDNGPCTFWAHDHILMLKSGERLVIYRDMTCEAAYCPKASTYDDYKSLDADHNCRVRILPDCTLSDM